MANPLRLYFDLSVIKDMDSHSIRVYECESVEADGTVIATVKLKAGLDYIEVTTYTDPFNWFRLEILDSNGASLILADSTILAENAYNKVTAIREAIKDTNSANPAFTSDDLISKIRMASIRLNNYRNIDSVPDSLWPVLIILVRIDICYVLAYDYAKYQRLEIPGGATFSRDELYKHYLELAKQLEEYYERIKVDLTDDVDLGIGTAGVNVSEMSRDSYETGMEEADLRSGRMLPPRFNS